MTDKTREDFEWAFMEMHGSDWLDIDNPVERMDSVHDILDEVAAIGPNFDPQTANRIRRAALVEAIRGLALEWRDCRGIFTVSDCGQKRYVIDASGDEWSVYFRNGIDKMMLIHSGTGGIPGALADYRRRVASMFEKQFPGITEEVANAAD